jgi:hypothetical protein
MKFLPLAVGLGLSAAAVLVVPGSGATASMQSAHVVDKPHPPASKYLKQRPKWAKCGDEEFRTYCAKITVPRDWANQYAGNDLQIAVSKVAPVKGTPSRVVFGNPGGPGGAGLGMAPYLASQPALAKDHLAVGFDPRGTGSSSTASCEGTPGFTMVPSRGNPPRQASERLGRTQTRRAPARDSDLLRQLIDGGGLFVVHTLQRALGA